MFVMAFLSTRMLLSVCVCMCVCVCVCVCVVISGKYPPSAIQVLAFKSDTVCKQSNVYKQQGLTYLW